MRFLHNTAVHVRIQISIYCMQFSWQCGGVTVSSLQYLYRIFTLTLVSIAFIYGLRIQRCVLPRSNCELTVMQPISEMGALRNKQVLYFPCPLLNPLDHSVLDDDHFCSLLADRDCTVYAIRGSDKVTLQSTLVKQMDAISEALSYIRKSHPLFYHCTVVAEGISCLYVLQLLSLGLRGHNNYAPILTDTALYFALLDPPPLHALNSEEGRTQILCEGFPWRQRRLPRNLRAEQGIVSSSRSSSTTSSDLLGSGMPRGAIHVREALGRRKRMVMICSDRLHLREEQAAHVCTKRRESIYGVDVAHTTDHGDHCYDSAAVLTAEVEQDEVCGEAAVEEAAELYGVLPVEHVGLHERRDCEHVQALVETDLIWSPIVKRRHTDLAQVLAKFIDNHVK